MTWGDNGHARPTTAAYRNNKFWDKGKKMDISLGQLTLEQLTNIERCVYNSDYEFTDDQFRSFIDQQLEFGLDPIQLELQDEVVYIYEEIYFFQALIEEGECVHL